MNTLVGWKKEILQQLLLNLEEQGEDKIVMVDEEGQPGSRLGFFTIRFSLSGDRLATCDAAYPEEGE